MELHKWQEEALTAWNKTKQGIIEAGTGTGKTQIALEIIKKFKTKTLIAVPTTELISQWRQDLIKLGIPKALIGQLGDGQQQLNKYTIGTFNSIRGKELTEFDLIIVDEIHHLSSTFNKNILSLPCKYFMGLSATIKKTDNSHKIIIDKYPIIYTYTQKRAISDKILANYTLIPVYVKLNEHEQREYDIADIYIKTHFLKFEYDLKKIHAIASNYMHPDHDEAKKIAQMINKRKEIVMNSQQRIERAAQLINERGKYEKIIVFSESIETAQKIYDLIDGYHKFIYHSKLTKKERNEIYKKFKDMKYGVIISCKALEEGVDFPSCKMGIIAGGTSQHRQAIQRLGRFLRKYDDMEAEVFDIVVSRTIDYSWFLKRYK